MAHTAADYTITNATAADINALNLALSYLDRSPKGNAVMQQVADKNVTINIVHDGSDSYRSSTNTINWDPNSALTVLTSGVGSVGVQSAALGLAHEGAHAIDPNLASNSATPDPQYGDLAEKYAVEQENIIASDLGEPQRFNHGGNLVEENNSTEHTTVNNAGSMIWVQSDSVGNITVQGTFELGTYPATAPVGGGTGTGTETVDGSDITVSPGPHRAVIIEGNNDTVIDDNAAISVAPGSFATIIGGADTVNVGAGGSLTLTGNNNSLTLTATSAANLTGTDETVSGSGATVTLGTNSSATFSGSGNTINAANGDVITENNAIINVAQGASVTITGTGDTIVAAGNNAISLFGGGDTVNLNGTGNYVGLNGNGSGAAYTVNGDVAGDTVLLNANTTATVTGAGGAVDLWGNGDVVTTSNQTIYTVDHATGEAIIGSGDIINPGSGFQGAVFGGGDTVNFSGTGNYVGLNGNGNADTVYGAGAGNSVAVNANTAATVNGSGGSIYLGGSGAVVTASNETIGTANNVTGEAIIGSGDIINPGSGFQGAVFGGGDTVNFTGTGNYVGLNGNGNADTVYGAGAGNTVAVNANTAATVNGSGGSIYLGGSGAVVTASNETIGTANNVTGESIIGSGDSIVATGNNTITVTGGGDTVTLSGTGNTVTLNGNANADTVNAGNAGGTVNLAGGTSAIVNGSGDTIVAAGNNTITVSGGGDIVNLNGTGNMVTLNGNANADTVNGDIAGDSVGLAGGTTATVTGSGGSIYLGGSGTVVTASNETISTANNLTGDAIIGSGDTINPGSAFHGDVFGSGDTVNFSGAGNVLVLHGNNDQADIVQNNSSGSEVSLTGSMTAEVYGNGGFIRLNASHETLTAGHETIQGGDNLTEEIVNGSSNTIYGGNNFGVTVAGANDTVNLGTSSRVLLISGDRNDDVHGDHDTIVAQPNVIDFIYGNADTYNGQFGNFNGDPVFGAGDDGSSFWDDWWPDDPIVLSLDGGAVRTQGLQTSTAFFDMQNTGQRVHTGWVTAGEGLLVYDPDGRDTVTSDRDLVGGFDALKELARKVDGTSLDKLSASDAIWAKLKVWVDATGTGDFDGDQLYTLGQLGIISIDLNAADVQRDSNGNTIVADSSFTRSDGTQGDIAGVALYFASGSAASSLAAQSPQLVPAMAGFAAAADQMLPMIAIHHSSLLITHGAELL